MADIDPFAQWVNVPDDLPPVDDDGLGTLATLGHQVDRFVDHQPSSGLLLACPGTPQNAGEFNAIACAVQISSDPSPSSISYASMYPPALSPDSSPYSVASSTPWLRTPMTDPSLANPANLSPLNGLWDIGGEGICDNIHFVDQSGNSLEDVPSQVHSVMPEDIACRPQIICKIPSYTPSIVVSPSHHVSTLPQIEAVPPSHGSSSPDWQSLWMYSPHMTHSSEESGHPPSPSLSPLSTLSILSQSPDTFPSYLPPFDYTSTPSLLPVPVSESDERTEMAPVSSTLDSVTLANLRGKRNTKVVDEVDPLSETPRRSKAKRHDDDEWNPHSGRVKRPRVATFPQSANESPLVTPSDLADGGEPNEGSEGSCDATHTCCEYCGQSFTRASDRIRHMENSANHPETRKMWPCPYCNSTLGRKDALSRHIRTLHRGAPTLIQVEGVLESHLPVSQRDAFMQRMGQRKMSLRRYPRRDVRTKSR